VACICHFFFCHNTLFFQKILCCGKFVTTHLLFESQHIISSKKILCCGHGAQYFLKKIMCCDKLNCHVQHIIFSKNIVLWLRQVCHNTLLFESQHIIMAALCNRGPLYFCPVVSIYLSIFFFSSPNLSGHRLDVYHTHIAWP